MTERRRGRRPRRGANEGAAAEPDSRAVALAALAGLRAGRNLPDALAAAGLSRLSERDRAFSRRLAQHAVRHRRRLQGGIEALLDKPSRDEGLRDLLWLGAAQLDLADIADHAAVNSTVNLAPKRLRGVVNAVLRRRLREPAGATLSPAEQASLPDWLHRAILADWGGQADALIQALNEEPALCLRVNRQRADREAYRQLLAERGIAAEPAGEDGLILAQSTSLEALPGFAEGQVSVQGVAAQAAAGLLRLAPGLRVLDGCAAPGGKTAHMLECQPDLAVTAVDLEEQRLRRVAENLARLGVEARLLAGDLAQDGPWAGRYQRILLDVPCSGTGVIGRHPDIKWLRREDDIPRLADQQLALLQRAWDWLEPGGLLLYCSCSILDAENDGVIGRFLAAQPQARLDAITLPFGQASEYGWRVPAQAGLEGFYYARLIR